MAAIVTNRGLQVIGGRASATADAFSEIQSMSVDDSETAFQAAHTTLNSGGAVSNHSTNNFDETPSRTNQTVSHLATFGTSQANFTIRRIALHNEASASVSDSSETLVAGVDGQAFTKTSNFSMRFELTLTYSDNS